MHLLYMLLTSVTTFHSSDRGIIVYEINTAGSQQRRVSPLVSYGERRVFIYIRGGPPPQSHILLSPVLHPNPHSSNCLCDTTINISCFLSGWSPKRFCVLFIVAGFEFRPDLACPSWMNPSGDYPIREPPRSRDYVKPPELPSDQGRSIPRYTRAL